MINLHLVEHQALGAYHVVIVVSGEVRVQPVGGFGAFTVADVVRIENGLLAEHWDVIQDEATRDESISGRPMFGAVFATRA